MSIIAFRLTLRLALSKVINQKTFEVFLQGKMASYRAPDVGGGSSIGGRTGEIFT